jgi:hypothetical protein
MICLLSEFAYGPRPQADYLYIYSILKDMGHQFDVILFPRDYHLPLEMVQKQYRFSNRRAEEIADHLRSEGRLHERDDGLWASFWGGILARTVPEIGAWAAWCSSGQGHHQRRA